MPVLNLSYKQMRKDMERVEARSTTLSGPALEERIIWYARMKGGTVRLRELHRHVTAFRRKRATEVAKVLRGMARRKLGRVKKVRGGNGCPGILFVLNEGAS